MSGIVGWVSWGRDRKTEARVVEAMLARLRHRGPDGRAMAVSGDAILGHCRLGVVDPKGDPDPTAYALGGREIVVALDGEIYNADELRERLTGRGHVFRTRTDSELVAHAYQEWGDDCVRDLDGMFAVAVWEKERRRLLLARDPLGVKPLFWARRDASVVFGSEMKAMLAHPEIEPVLSEEGLAEVVVVPPTLGTTPGVTPFRDIREARPGHFVVCDEKTTNERRYWYLVSKPHTDGLDATVERVRDLLVGAVERRLTGDLPLAFTLSGGIDSSAVLSIGARALRARKKPVHAWSVDFVESEAHFVPDAMMGSRDAPFAAAVAAEFATEHHVVTLDPAAMVDRILDAMRARDVPYGTQRDTSLILLSERMKPHASVTLSGVTSDELFAGYHWLPGHDTKRNSFQWVAPPPPGAPWPMWISSDVLARVRPMEYLTKRYEEAREEVPRLDGESPEAAKHREDMYMTLTRRLPYMLERRDRMAMFAGVDDRVPFADKRLVEYMWNVPEEMKRVDGFEKGLLRRALEGFLSDEIRSRKKSAFPAIQHPGFVAGLVELARERISNLSGVSKDLISAERAMSLTTSTEWAAPFRLAYVVQLDAWVREYGVRLP